MEQFTISGWEKSEQELKRLLERTTTVKEIRRVGENHLEVLLKAAGDDIFSEEQKREIWEKKKAGYSERRLAQEYKCSRTPIQRVIREMEVTDGTSIENDNRTKDILFRRKTGETYKEIGERYGLTPQAIKYICDSRRGGDK